MVLPFLKVLEVKNSDKEKEACGCKNENTRNDIVDGWSVITSIKTTVFEGEWDRVHRFKRFLKY